MASGGALRYAVFQSGLPVSDVRKMRRCQVSCVAAAASYTMGGDWYLID